MKDLLEKLKALQESNPDKASEFAEMVSEENNEKFVEAIAKFLEIDLKSESFENEDETSKFFEDAKEIFTEMKKKDKKETFSKNKGDDDDDKNEAKLKGKAKEDFLKKMGKKPADKDSDDKDSDDDDSDDDKKEKKKMKKDSIDSKIITKMLALLNVNEDDLEEFSAILREEIVRVADEFAKDSNAKLTVENEKSIETLKAEHAVTIEKYVEKAVAEFVEANQSAIIDSEELDTHRAFVEKMKAVYEEFDLETSEEKSPILEGLRSELVEKNIRIDELSDKLHTNRNILMVEQSKNVITESSRGMTAVDKEKFSSLVEDIEFSNMEDFKVKTEKIRERYFVVTEVSENDEALIIESSLENDDTKIVPKGKSLTDAIRGMNNAA